MFIIFRTDDVVYETGFPEQDSEGISSFMGAYLLASVTSLIRDTENYYLYTDQNNLSDNEQLTYYRVSKAKLQQYYKSMFSTNDQADTLRKLFENDKLKEGLYEEVDDVEADYLPIVRGEEEKLFIERGEAQKTIDLITYDERLQPAEELTYRLDHANEHGFILFIENYTEDERFYLFALHDLSEINIYEANEIETVAEKGELAAYYDLLEPIGEEGKYAKLPIYSFIDMTEDRVYHIEQDDELSNDLKYVYIGGNKRDLEDGTQKIQKTEDYLAGNSTYETTFKLSFKKIAKKADINRLGGIGLSKLNYFDENIVVLGITYNGFITGTAGGTNAIFDLETDPDNPTVYVVDMDILFDL